ncbi:hypothetical protein NDU88_005292 [Pleurodeles waltl]|uniref:Uncharacterized protein n=1 Tax=Pleurodeles waltl TaxID=8319 RepID=A0AAV7SLG9_PLEWA|nr:hypothetical protein NDU88_005292 [Pleurodeles waltl]
MRERPSPSVRTILQAPGPAAQSSCYGAQGEPLGPQSLGAMRRRAAGERPVLWPRPPLAPLQVELTGLEHMLSLQDLSTSGVRRAKPNQVLAGLKLELVELDEDRNMSKDPDNRIEPED